MRPLRLLILVGALWTVAACSTAVTPTPSPSAPPAASPSAPAAPSASPSDAATPAPTATPEPTPVPSLSADETELIGRLRADAAIDCVPRRTDLPAGALYGIECQPGDSLVQRVGVLPLRHAERRRFRLPDAHERRGDRPQHRQTASPTRPVTTPTSPATARAPWTRPACSTGRARPS